LSLAPVHMIKRAVASLVLTCALTFGAALSASPQEQGATPPPAPEPMTFYIVKGANDSCGRGCDSWIQAEGKIEADTPARFKAILDRVRDRNLPIYFASLGGNLERAMTMGNMLHARSIAAGVGRTVVQECGFEAQDGEACIALKNSGRELHGELLTNAVCASACPYFFVGATVHEVAPDAVLAVHSPKVMLNDRMGHLDASAIAAADQRGHERVDSMAAVYLTKMGIDAGLLVLTKTVKFEDIHVLTRDEIARFGVDRREAAETRWRFEGNGLSMLHKIAVVRRPGEASFRLLQWRVTCFDARRFVLNFLRPISASPNLSSVSMAGDDGLPVYYFNPAPMTASGREQWGMQLGQFDLQSLLDLPQIEFTETSPAEDGHRVSQTIKLSNEGGATALASFFATCRAASGSAAPQAIQPGGAVAK
jgi:hypothetical protein